MNTTTLKSKKQLNTAFRQAIEEKKELFNEIIADVMEDIALGKAIEEGLKTPKVSEDEVFKTLRAR
jgi:hypothetical protein